MHVAGLAAALLLALGGIAWLRPMPDRGAPTPMPADGCLTWMADAIPGVGPKTRDAVAARIRAGDVPAVARDWFAASP
ncbi:MAG: hypothetical protein J0M02_04110 [Planctomycetes bacterium]|nr:hypothetical protein [Planctomycetota bacterium]